MQVGWPSAEATSPELVLVDSRLAHRAREALRTPGDTLARIEHEIWLRRLTFQEILDVDQSSASAPSICRPPDVRTPSVRARPRLVAAGTAAGTLAVALLLGVQIDLRGNPAVADTVADPAPVPMRTGGPDTSTPKISHPKPVDRPSVRKRQSRPFAWAPVDGASRYRVEFFRGDSRIYSIETMLPELDLPYTWQFRGRSERLRPGVYRWYVWPVQDGRRQARATVQAELVVS